MGTEVTCICPKANECRTRLHLRGCEHDYPHIERHGCYVEIPTEIWSKTCPNCVNITGIVLVEEEVSLDLGT